ncbi:MAG: tyrosine recombinase [Spirochaetaceae bacterium]|jgi:integrase/recombinase XerD|nr:tyrosine recombinase [Spirochaetaceae bacterium]
MDTRLLEQYRSSLLVTEHRALLTVETYETEIRMFLAWISESGLEALTVNPGDLGRYLDFRRTKNSIDSRSAAKAISALRSFFRYMVNEGLREDNPAQILELPKRKQKLPAVLSREAVEKMLASIDVSGPRGIRDRALFEFIYSAGLRISEAAGLKLSDVFFDEKTAKVRGKGGKERLVPFGDEAARWLRTYLDKARPNLAGASTGQALFIRKGGRRLSRKGIWKNYRAITGLLGLGSRVHTLRHSYATELLYGGADLRSVQELLGHADLATTQIYTHVDVSLLRENHRRYLPKLREYTK